MIFSERGKICSKERLITIFRDYIDKMPTILPVNGNTPQIGEDCFIAENATVVGEVKMGKKCTIWFNAVVRGDVNSIDIGECTNIQDGAVIHCTYKTASTKIGNRVSVGHNAIVHGCTIRDDVLIGMGSIVMDHCDIGENSVIAAGAVVLEGTIVEAGSVYAGVPAKKVKDIDDKLRDIIKRTADNYPKYAEWFR